MASKTAQRILFTSLELFNQDGEANVTSVDIANELDISPGNLYYHFKGKEEIINELFTMYKTRLNGLLFSPSSSSLAIKEFFHFLYLIFETSHLFRFLYRNPSDLANKYPHIEKSITRLVKEKEKGLEAILHGFVSRQAIAIPEQDIQHLNELIIMVITQHLNFYLMKNEDINDESIIYRGLSLIFFAVSPWLVMDSEDKLSLYHLITTGAFNQQDE